MLIKSLIIAFSMYSKIPMPKVEWNEKNMKYCFCFFPFVGAVIGAVIYFLGTALLKINVGRLLFSCIMSAVPIILTGGIHFDGFLDTMDAVGSYADKEKRLEILKDSNSGAFAVMGGIIYFALSVGFWSEAREDMLLYISAGYCISRSLSGLSVVSFKTAKDKGLAAVFANSSQKTAVRALMLIYLALEYGILLFFNIYIGAAVILISILCFLYHYYNCIKNFGGITGDLAGYFLQICELCLLMAIVAAFKITDSL